MLEAIAALLRNNVDLILGVLLLLVPALVAVLFRALGRPQQDQLLGATKTAYLVVAAVAGRTPMTWDDALAKVLKVAADEMGRQLKPKEKDRVARIATGLLADPGRPDLVGGDDKAIALRNLLTRSGA